MHRLRHNRRKNSTISSSLLLILLLSSSGWDGHATTIAPFSFDQVVEKAEAICRVKCVGCKSAWDDQKNTIYTTTTFYILDHIKGAAETDQVILSLPGGTVDDTTLTIPGFPLFHPEDELVIFLTGSDRRGFQWPVGMTQGIYPVFQEANGGLSVIPKTGTILTKPAAGTPSPPQPIPLDAFILMIRERLGMAAPLGEDGSASSPR